MGVNSSSYIALFAIKKLAVENPTNATNLTYSSGQIIPKINLGSQAMPNSKALGLVWDVESDKLCVSERNLLDISTRREMLSSLTGQFDPLGILASCLPEEKLILQNVATLD